MPIHRDLPGVSARRRRERAEKKAQSAAEPVRENSSVKDQVPAQQAPATYLGELGAMDEAYEQRALGGKNEPGHLLQVSRGRPGAGSRISVHGIRGNPGDVDPLTKLGLEDGARTSSFAYDDQHRRLDDVSDDLVAALRAEMKANPKGPLTLDAHSMGTRVVLDAVRKLSEGGELGNRPVNLNLVAPLLAGITGGGAELGTNLSRLAIPGMGALIPGLQPGKDMGTGSSFQDRLEGMELPKNVHTRLFTGTEDSLVDPAHPTWQAMAERLNAEQITLPGADHDGSVDAAARHMRKHD
ncbi:MAG: hypothetical protein R3F61_05670 [Myxococcota bacterium]